jgi:hypothetical protein
MFDWTLAWTLRILTIVQRTEDGEFIWQIYKSEEWRSIRDDEIDKERELS